MIRISSKLGHVVLKALFYPQTAQKIVCKLYAVVTALALLSLSLAACMAPPAGVAGLDSLSTPDLEGSHLSGKLVIYSGRSEQLIQPVLDRFKSDHPDLQILLKSGKNSELANALLEEKNNPQADVFITTEIITMQALQQAGIFQSYASAAATHLPQYAIGPDSQWYGLARRLRTIMYNTDLVPADQLPDSIFDLSDPAWKGQVASANSTNGSLQAQLASMRQLLGEEATQAWLHGLVSNEVTWFGGHTDVRKAVGAGEFKLGLVNHYYYYLQLEEGSPVGIIFPDQEEGGLGLITNLTAIGIIGGNQNQAAARALVDFLLSEEGQQLFAELNYEYPLIPEVSTHPDLQPLEGFHFAEVDTSRAAADLDSIFDLMERAGLP